MRRTISIPQGYAINNNLDIIDAIIISSGYTNYDKFVSSCPIANICLEDFNKRVALLTDHYGYKEIEIKKIAEPENLERYDIVVKFLDYQQQNIPILKYLIGKDGDDYYKKQYVHYKLLMNDLRLNNLPEETFIKIARYVMGDRFRCKQVGSIGKFRDKNKDNVPYWVYFLGQLDKTNKSGIMIIQETTPQLPINSKQRFVQ